MVGCRGHLARRCGENHTAKCGEDANVESIAHDFDTFNGKVGLRAEVRLTIDV